MKEFSRRDEVLEMKNASLEEGLQSTLVVAQNEYRYVADIEESYDDFPPVRCNLGDLNQVFLNLIVNASHAIADKIGFRPESKGTITVKTYRDGDVAVVEIEIRVTGSHLTFTKESSSHSSRPKKLEEAVGRASLFLTQSSWTNTKGSSTLRPNKVLARHFSSAYQFREQI